MLKNILVLPDGTEISSGAGESRVIQSCTLTECVNSGEELILGSVCSACLEVQIIVMSGPLGVAAGTEITLYKEDDSGRYPVGIFIAEKPVHSGANVYKLTAYDYVTKLDKDLSTWLTGLKGWPYTLGNFAKLVCQACGVTLASADFPNKDFSVIQFHRPQVTGRQLMQWIGELACRFCRARADGTLELGWYSPAGKTITPTGQWYIFGGSLSYGDYTVAKIDGVKLRLANSDSGALWPDGEAENPYILQGNPLIAGTTPTVETALATIQEQLSSLPSYRAGKVSIPAGMDIRAGHTVNVIDANNNRVTLCVMTKTNSGQRDTLECTGSANRSSSTAVNNPTTQQVAQQTVAAMTHEEVFNKLTNNGAIQGIYVQDGKWYINAELAQIINLTAESIDTESLTVDAAQIKSGTISSARIPNLSADKITSGTLAAGRIDGSTLTIKKGATIAGWSIDDNSIYSTSGDWHKGTFMCRGSDGAYSIGGSDSISGWVFGAGGKFGVTNEGDVWCSALHATGGSKIGAWYVNEHGALTSSDTNGTDEVVNTVYMETDRLFYMYNQSAGDGIFVRWVDVIRCVQDWLSKNTSNAE